MDRPRLARPAGALRIARSLLLITTALAASSCTAGGKPHPMYAKAQTPVVRVVFGRSPVLSDPPPPEQVRLLIRCFLQRTEARDRAGLAQLAPASEADAATEADRVIKTYGKAAHGNVVAHISDEDPKDSRGGYLEFTGTGQRMTVELARENDTWWIDLYAAKAYH
ncbi:hypothetical protein [Streptomyces sp. NPDC046985]|uniref:hypothetical protein n=1 Tax=Streptomyces sp. NPDC046985 TaxID=3155377 RepID=UPI00340B0AF3